MEQGEFGLLGPLRVGPAGTVRAAKPRALLAALLLGANRVRPVDWLISVLWDDEPPAYARNLISGYVGDLRRLLAPEDLIRHTPAGYEIDIDPGRIDWFQFEQRVRHARALLTADDPGAASEELAAALALWRGPALCDVSSRQLQETEAPRLTAARKEAEQLRVEVAFGLDRHEAELPRLAELTAEFPLDEDFYRLRMLAEYRAGRRAAALAVFQLAHEVLRAELGVAPGRELRELARAVRDDDPALARAPRPLLPSCELPPDLADFTARDAELARLTGSPGAVAPAVAVVTGPGGVGKTVLAVRASWLLRERYPDGQLFADLRAGRGERVDPGDVLAHFLGALGVGSGSVPATAPERGRLFRSLAVNRRLLVLLDDAADEDQVRTLLPTGTGSYTLVTCRRPLSGLAGAIPVPLNLFEHAEATRLLERLVGADRVAADAAAADELVRLCGHLPLGVRVAGAKLASRPEWTIADLVGRLRDEHRRLDELVAGDVGVRASLEVSYRECDPAARQVFRRFGLLTAPDVPAWVVAALLVDDDTPISVPDAERLLDRLVEVRLVAEARRDALGQLRYRCHELMTVFARERLAEEESPRDRAMALRSVLVGYAASAALASRELGEDLRLVAKADVEGAVPEAVITLIRRSPMDWYRVERDGLISAVAAAAGWEGGYLDPGLVWRLALAQVPLAATDGDHAHREVVLRHALDAADTSGDGWARVAVRNALGELYLDQVRWPEAEATLSAAIGLAETSADAAGAAFARLLLGMVHRDAGRAADAVRALRPALTSFRAHGDPVGQLRALRGLALTRYGRGEGEHAVRRFLRCRDLAEALGYPWTAYVRTDLARAYRQLGRHEDALAELAAALEVFAARDNQVWAGATRRELGEVLRELGRHDEALDQLRQARDVFVRIGDLHWRGYIDCAIGDTYLRLGRDRDALAEYLAAERVLLLFDDERGIARTRDSIARVRGTLGRPG